MASLAVVTAGRATVQRALPGILFAVVLLIYMAFPTKDYYWDGISFAQNIEDAPRLSPSLFHPNHLAYTSMGYGLWRLFGTAGIQIRSLRVLQMINGIFAAATAVLLFEILLTLLPSAYMSIVLTVLFAFSATWWKFSTDANAYVPSVFFLLSCFYHLLPDRRSRPLLVATVHSAAMMFHELAVLFLPVAVLGILQQNTTKPLPDRLKAVAQYAAAAFCGTIAVYVSAFSLQQKSTDPEAFVNWVTSHAPTATFSFTFWRNLLLSFRGTLQLLLARKASWIVEPDAISLILAMVLSTTVLLLLMILFATRRELPRLPSDWERRTRIIALMSLTWIGCYALFLLVWQPANTFYRLFYLPAIILLIATAWAEAGKGTGYQHRGRAALVVGALALFNFTFSILPHARTKNNPRVEFALRMQPLWKPGTVIYYSDFAGNIDDWTIRYFNPQTEWRQFDVRVPRFNGAITQRQAQKVWLDTTALDLLARDQELRARFEANMELGIVYHAGIGYNIRFAEVKLLGR